MNPDRAAQIFAAADVSSSDAGVYTAIGGLMLVGLLLMLLAAWLFKATKPELDLLAPLELMGDRKWLRLDPAGQRRELDGVRPAGARPIERAAQAPSLDDDFEKSVPDLASFDDLRSMQAADARRTDAARSAFAAAAAASAEAAPLPGTPRPPSRPADLDDTTELAIPAIDVQG